MFATDAYAARIGLAPQSIASATTITGPAVDVRAASTVVVVLAADITSGAVAVSAIEESDDGATFSAMDQTAVGGALPSLAADGAAHVVVRPNRPFLRVKTTTTGATVNLIAACTLVLTDLKFAA